LIDFGLAKKENSTNPLPLDAAAKGKSDVPVVEEKENVIDPKTGKKKSAAQTLREYMNEE